MHLIVPGGNRIRYTRLDGNMKKVGMAALMCLLLAGCSWKTPEELARDKEENKTNWELQHADDLRNRTSKEFQAAVDKTIYAKDKRAGICYALVARSVAYVSHTVLVVPCKGLEGIVK